MISYPFQNAFAVDMNSDRVHPMIDIQKTEKQLKTHLQTLTMTIGERSVQFPENLNKTANYIQRYFENIGLSVKSEPYDYHGIKVANIVAELSSGAYPPIFIFWEPTMTPLPALLVRMTTPVQLPCSWRPPGF